MQHENAYTQRTDYCPDGCTVVHTHRMRDGVADNISAKNLYTDLIVIAQRRSHAAAAEHLVEAAKRIRAAERERCAAWAKLYWDGDLPDDYEMYVGIRD